MPDPKRKIYEFAGDGLTVRWDLKRCIHAEECVHRLPKVFDPQKRPWIEAGLATAEEVRDTVMSCPTGALHYEPTDGGRAEPTPQSNRIAVGPDGPLYISGDLSIGLPSGHTTHDNRVALCRCGDSKNKPFCDNTHLDTGFSDDGHLGESKLGTPEIEGSGIAISLAADGPLILSGEMTADGPGSEPQTGTRAALCRCGASQNKPYCDGAHRTIGFSSA